MQKIEINICMRCVRELLKCLHSDAIESVISSVFFVTYVYKKAYNCTSLVQMRRLLSRRIKTRKYRAKEKLEKVFSRTELLTEVVFDNDTNHTEVQRNNYINYTSQ